MNPRDWNSHVAALAAEDQMAAQLSEEAEQVTAFSWESGLWEAFYRGLIMHRILEVSTDPRPGHD